MTANGVAMTDFKGLQTLQLKARNDSEKALPEAAKQFEAIFLQAMIKSMRAQHFVEEGTVFRTKYEQTFQEMLDGQYASEITKGPGIGLADMLTTQLSKTISRQSTPAGEGARGYPLHVNQGFPLHVNQGFPLKAGQQGFALQRAAAPSSIPLKTHTGYPLQHQAAMQQAYAVKPPLKPQTPAAQQGKTAQSIDEFVKSIWPYAQQAASMLGLDPKLLVAQAALETGWGQYVTRDEDGSSSNNFFNIKSTGKQQNEAVEVKTTEYVADIPVRTKASFKKYSSVENSFADYVSLIKDNSRYEQALANANDPHRFIKALHDAGYATDPRYADKILSIYHGDELQQALERIGYTME
ncbi:flagellar assembly peptidoglycan hydrolase FlgJ [Legionella sp. MW5194]|uniref:flagellar assembly peptidoglycan hydrolase FlgJ n=1 Tax=Legionella sp. MW5194 TaxID=2662448 RepID=UPI00193D7B4E|nr:flagellar assembly peptidoglycan hydrolase FlgJ [Legionella sp. MW5194]QRN04167.1 flagellar assembly peptidoglycan hydrolase FlgJ [Legionella sp. MW5194]